MSNSISKIFSFAIVLFFSGCNTNSLLDELNIAAAEINNICPITLGNETRLDAAKVHERNFGQKKEYALEFRYTLLNQTRSGSSITVLRELLRIGIEKDIKTDISLQYYRDNGITLIYTYLNREGALITQLTFEPGEY
jgi:hypothetical protein